jgi:arginine utilization regulatory protein
MHVAAVSRGSPVTSDLTSFSHLDELDIFGVLANFDEGVIITDPNGRIVFYNDTQSNIDSLEPEFVLGKHVSEVYNLDQGSSMILRCLDSNRPILGELFFYRTCRGTVANTIHSVFPLRRRGQLVGVICFVKDYYLLEKTIAASSHVHPHEDRGLGNGTRHTFADIVGVGDPFLQAVKMARLAANTPSPIMLYGETGTGKEMFAQSIHNYSNRKNERFVGINCAAIPENLLEGLLFGTRRGAFTGAVNKPGFFEQAHNGTLLLDEVDSMPLNLQAKLLRTLQERKIRRIGGLEEIQIDVKVISTTNSDPHQAIKERRLRMDLFYRLGVVFIRIPPLRELGDGIDAFVRHFIYKNNLALGKNIRGVSPAVARLFRRYFWPGNVRELEHVIEGAMTMLEGHDVIEHSQLPGHFLQSQQRPATDRGPGEGQAASAASEASAGAAANREDGSHPPALPPRDLPHFQKTRERAMLHEALKAARGNIARAARRIKISRQLLHYKMKKHGLVREHYLD